MRLSKWDGSPDKNKTTLIGGGSGGDGGTTEQPPSRGEGDRKLWGNNDSGDDIEGSMTVNGNVTIKAIVPPTYEPDDEGDDGENENEETGGGNLDVELDATVGRHLYINYPHPDHKGEKKCVGELIKGNADNIASLTTKVNTNTTNIANLTQTVNTNTTNISNNADEISKLKAGSLTEDDVLKLIRDNQPSKLGAYDQPVVLFTGRARRVSYYNDRYYIEGHKLPYFSISNTISGGLMTISITPQEGYQVCIYGVHCNQERSGDTTDAIDNPTVTGRSDGAHWFECRVDTPANTKTVYIREMHQRNGDNDSWGTTDWFADGGIKAIHFTLLGYIMPPIT